jgi:hypothetical protein
MGEWEGALRILIWGLVGVFGLAFAVGWLLPATREGRAGAFIEAEPERILEVIQRVEVQPEWRSGVASVERTAGGWVEVTARGERIDFEAVEMTAARVHLRFVSDAGYEGEWVAVMVPEDAGTRIEVVERATVAGPLRRLLARVMFDPEAFAAEYLAALKARSEGL